MVIESISPKFSHLLVTVTMIITSLFILRDGNKNKTERALCGSPTLYFVKGTRTIENEMVFPFSFGVGKMIKPRKSKRKKTPRITGGSQVSGTS